MKKSYPSLSSKGWIEDPTGVIDSVIANFFLTHSSLNLDYRNAIIAFPELIQRWGNSSTDIGRETTEALQILLNRWFDEATVDVRVNYPFPNDDTRMGLTIYATVEREGLTYNVAKELALLNGKVVDIMRINNG